MTQARRWRELGFLLPAAVLGALAAGSVAAARTDDLDLSPLPGALAVLAVFLIMHAVLRVRAPLADPYVLPIVGVICGVGLAAVYRVDAELARDQVIWVAVGAAVFVAVIALLPDPRVLQSYRYLIGLGGVGLLLITMAFGTTINGAKLWIELPGGQTVQLGEVAKVLIVIFIAGYLRDKREVLAIPDRSIGSIGVPAARHFGPVVVLVALALALVIVLNDFGTALLFFGAFLAMLYMATGRIAYVAAGVSLFAVGSAAVYAAVPRVSDRVDVWLHPFDDPEGRGFQLVQSLYALADGGIGGRGLGKAFLVGEDGQRVIPALETDFIFSAVAAELGYIGGVAVLLSFLLLMQRGFVISSEANDGFSKLLAGGLTAVLALQTLLIVGGVVRLVPLTGVTLPFMSYGGSSVVTNFGLIALLLAISHRARAGAAVRRGRGRG
ncbi:MAG: FtsW/RodA/SpoVE family cell cycle protein [Thermoleophilia bacterium]|nr:FtsW/RodA/SpoVE family cell cycle protein [Thermoleophilia bacterium]